MVFTYRKKIQEVKNLGASLREIKPVYPAKKAALVQLAALNALQNNFLKQSFTNKGISVGHGTLP